MAGRKGCLRRGCGCLVLLLVIGAVVAAIVYLRSSGEPEVYQEQRQMLEQRSPDERRELAEQTRQRLRDVLRRPPSESSSSYAGEMPDAEGRESRTGPGERTQAPESTPGDEPRDRPGEKLRDTSPEKPREKPRAKPPEDEDEEKGARRITLRLDELNALLEQEASRWMSEQGSDQLPLSNPTLAIEDDHLVLFVQLSTPATTVLLGLPFQATVDETGGVVNLLGVRLGQLALPGLEALPRMLRAAKDPRLDRLAEKADAAAAGYPIEPRLDLGGGRALWVLDAEIDPEEQAVHLLVEEG